jgi:hypothetical protein
VRDLSALRERYMKDGLPVRLGGLAANLARVGSFSDDPEHREVVAGLLEESKLFIEWTVPEADLQVQAQLVDLRCQLARWGLHWESVWADPAQRAAVAERARDWSHRLLELSGLLQPDSC